ncbi:hypothetical protein MTR_7g077250 [Medicago truncatula]|uniref:Uncharacterized protein n=1 Tax=Medicago truncatula TaxID=3880 RepID=G7L4K9_MEDTR|nr:hypothetical protein MTR_7g077250 [Medicago truncatula]
MEPIDEDRWSIRSARNYAKWIRKTWCKSNRGSKNKLKICVDTNIFEKISKVTRYKEAWNIVEKYHEGVDKVKTLTSKFDFIVVVIQESKDVTTMKIEEMIRGTKILVQQALQVQITKKDGKKGSRRLMLKSGCFDF